MPDQHWWGCQLSCPTCHADTTLQSALYSADGQLRFIYYCPACKEIYNYLVFASALAHQALMNDLNRIVQKQRLAIQPPIQPLPPTITDDDKKFLKDDGIDPESLNGGLQ